MFSYSRVIKVKLYKMEKSNERICLDDLYTSDEIKNLVRDILSEEFDASFERLMKDAKNVKSLLAIPAKKHFDKIRTQFIEYGMKMETLDDLKNILDYLKVWDEVDASQEFVLKSPEKSHICNE